MYSRMEGLQHSQSSPQGVSLLLDTILYTRRFRDAEHVELQRNYQIVHAICMLCMHDGKHPFTNTEEKIV